MSIYLGQRLPVTSSSLPGSHRAANNDCSLFGLAPDGVYLAGRVTPTAGELLPHRFTLATREPVKQTGPPFGGLLSVALFPDLATGRRYRPSCSVEPGLSSGHLSKATSEHPIDLNVLTSPSRS